MADPFATALAYLEQSDAEKARHHAQQLNTAKVALEAERIRGLSQESQQRVLASRHQLQTTLDARRQLREVVTRKVTGAYTAFATASKHGPMGDVSAMLVEYNGLKDFADMRVSNDADVNAVLASSARQNTGMTKALDSMASYLQKPNVLRSEVYKNEPESGDRMSMFEINQLALNGDRSAMQWIIDQSRVKSQDEIPQKVLDNWDITVWPDVETGGVKFAYNGTPEAQRINDLREASVARGMTLEQTLQAQNESNREVRAKQEFNQIVKQRAEEKKSNPLFSDMTDFQREEFSRAELMSEQASDAAWHRAYVATGKDVEKADEARRVYEDVFRIQQGTATQIVKDKNTVDDLKLAVLSGDTQAYEDTWFGTLKDMDKAGLPFHSTEVYADVYDLLQKEHTALYLKMQSSNDQIELKDLNKRYISLSETIASLKEIELLHDGVASGSITDPDFAKLRRSIGTVAAAPIRAIKGIVRNALGSNEDKAQNRLGMIAASDLSDTIMKFNTISDPAKRQKLYGELTDKLDDLVKLSGQAETHKIMESEVRKMEERMQKASPTAQEPPATLYRIKSATETSQPMSFTEAQRAKEQLAQSGQEVEVVEIQPDGSSNPVESERGPEVTGSRATLPRLDTLQLPPLTTGANTQ